MDSGTCAPDKDRFIIVARTGSSVVEHSFKRAVGSGSSLHVALDVFPSNILISSSVAGSNAESFYQNFLEITFLLLLVVQIHHIEMRCCT